MVRHYFPGVDLETISDEDFAKRANEAVWLADRLNPFGDGGSGKKKGEK